MNHGDFHDFIVPGLDVLIGDPEFLTPKRGTKPKAKTLVIPSFYVYRVLDFCGEQGNRGDSAKELNAIFGKISNAMNHMESDTFTFDNGMELTFRDLPENPTFRGLNGDSHKRRGSSKFHAIAVAKALQKEVGKEDVAIMTGSDQLATPAAFNGVDIARINPDVYTGRIKAQFPADFASFWWTNHSIPKDVWDELFPDNRLLVNQYVELIFDPHGQVDNSYQNIGRFDGKAIVPLRFARIKHPAFHRIYPKTPGQAMLFDALLAPVDETPIVIVSGTFGTGKTFCTVAAGLAQALENEYRRIFICPRDGSLGREIGYLRGDKLDKILPQAAPILDALEKVVELMDAKISCDMDTGSNDNKGKRKNENNDQSYACIKRLAEKYREKYFEFEPIIYMGGRSIGSSYIIYDEFQDMERGQTRALLSRIGDDSKIVVMGDPDQTTNPHLNRTSNGLSFAASKMAGDSLTAVVTFDENSEIVRSAAARHIAECLSSHKFTNV